MSVGVTLIPSMGTTETPVAEVGDQLPFGTYETTFAPVTSTDKELDGWHEPGATAGLTSNVNTRCAVCPL